MIVYVHTFPNGKVYVGITSKKPSQRWQSGFGYRRNSYMERAIKKYGWSNIDHTIICNEISRSEAETLEKTLIQAYQSNNRNYGYNLTSGGEKGKKHSPETIEKMRKNAKPLRGKDSPRYGKTVSEEHKQLISLLNKGNKYCLGRKHTQEARKKMVENHRDFKGENHPRYGIKHTEEARIKISQNRVYKYGPDNPNSKKVIQETLNGEFVRTWDSCTDAMKNFRGKFAGTIKQCCQGRTKTAYGFVWKYAV